MCYKTVPLFTFMLITSFLYNCSGNPGGLNYGWYNKILRQRSGPDSFNYYSPGRSHTSDFRPGNQKQNQFQPQEQTNLATSPRYFPGETTSFKRSVRNHQKPFRPSPLIHASSQHHFTHPLRKPPTFDSEEEFIRPSSNISPTAPRLTRQNLKNYPTDNHFSQQSSNIYQPKSQLTRQSSIRQESVQGPFQENLIQFKRPPSTLRDNAIPHSRPISIPSSSGADFPELPKFLNDISFNFDEKMKNVEKSANSLSPSIRFKPVNYQQDPKYQKEPVYEEQEFHGNIEPHNFGPQPVDYEPEQADIFPSAPASFLSVDSADLELSPEGQGCVADNGQFYFGGQTWSLPDCGRGVCAKTLRGGWEVTEERCDSIMQNPQYTCVIDEALRQEFPDCCPKPVQCN